MTVVYQPALISYRAIFFDQLDRMLGGRLKVYAGIQSRENSVTTTDISAVWLRVVDNWWLMGKRLLFQRGGLCVAITSKHLVLTLNPRFLHNWLLLILRAILRKRTIIWGHLHSRGGSGSWTNVLRHLQVRLGTALLVYTETEREQFDKIPIKRPCLALGNSCVRDIDCTPALNGTAQVPRGILYVGRLDRSKKVSILVEAFALIAENCSETRLVIVGDGDDRALLEKQYRRLIESGRLEFKGWVWDEAQLRACYEAALFTVSPGYGGLNIIQSMAYGLPIAVPRGENHSPEIEACVDGFNCLWFQKEDAPSLARVISEFQREAAHWYERRTEISGWTRRRYTIEHMVEQFVTMLAMVDDMDSYEELARVI